MGGGDNWKYRIIFQTRMYQFTRVRIETKLSCENRSLEKEEESNEENFKKEFGRTEKGEEEATGEARHLSW